MWLLSIVVFHALCSIKADTKTFLREGKSRALDKFMSKPEGGLSLHSQENSPGQQVNAVQEEVGAYWPKGIVPYYFDSGSYDYLIARRLRIAMNSLESSSCVKFKPLIIKPSANMSWVHFTNRNHYRECSHEPRLKENGEIEVILGLDCLKSRDIVHALLHAIGLKDEISHPHRDQYVRVLWENIHPEYRHLFRVQSPDIKSETLVEYDPLSVMHFHDRAFSKNGQATIAPLVLGLLINPSDDLSQLDKMKLRLLFGHECNRRKVGDLLETCKTAMSKKQKLKGDKNSNSTKISDSREPDSSDITSDEIKKNTSGSSLNEIVTENSREDNAVNKSIQKHNDEKESNENKSSIDVTNTEQDDSKKSNNASSDENVDVTDEESEEATVSEQSGNELTAGEKSNGDCAVDETPDGNGGCIGPKKHRDLYATI